MTRRRGRPRMQKKRTSLIRIGAVVAVIAVVLWGTQDQWRGVLFANANAPTDKTGVGIGSATQERAIQGAPVIVDAAGEAADTVSIDAIGTARAVRSVVIFPETEGEIVEFPVLSGERVARGDIILQLDARDARLAVRVVETRVKEATSVLARARQLRANNVRSAANVEDAEFVLERTQLELDQAREALADRTLRAPFDGIVGIPKVETGDRVTRATEIITIDDRSKLLVEVEVAERYLARLAVGMPVTAQTPTFPDTPVDGRIVKIDSRVDPVSRTVLVRAEFDNPDDSLRPGMSFFVNLRLPGPTYASVPELSLQWRDGQSYVWKIVDGASQRVPVVAKRRLNSQVLIEGEIAPGDLVVVEGVQRLRNGRTVSIVGEQGGS